jgi:hypothetical protein
MIVILPLFDLILFIRKKKIKLIDGLSMPIEIYIRLK